jgi:hypothetical protein
MASMMCPSATSSAAPTTTTLAQPPELTLLASAAKEGAGTLYDFDVLIYIFFASPKSTTKFVGFYKKSNSGVE